MLKKQRSDIAFENSYLHSTFCYINMSGNFEQFSLTAESFKTTQHKEGGDNRAGSG